jgi:hypothetical protein
VDPGVSLRDSLSKSGKGLVSDSKFTSPSYSREEISIHNLMEMLSSRKDGLTSIHHACHNLSLLDGTDLNLTGSFKKLAHQTSDKKHHHYSVDLLVYREFCCLGRGRKLWSRLW